MDGSASSLDELGIFAQLFDIFLLELSLGRNLIRDAREADPGSAFAITVTVNNLPRTTL